MIHLPLLQLDGRYLYYTFVAGAHKILENQSEINNINVFPVSDKDTGTNLASTIRSVLDNIRPNRSYKITATNIAEAALTGARGNSGVIFAQFLYGMSLEISNKKRVTIAEFAESVKKSVRYIYEAVANPVEGTILTVIKDWAEYIYKEKHSVTDFKQMLINSFEVLNVSLQETKTKLKILAQSNVVDAGAKGFVLFIEGIIELIKEGDLRKLLNEQVQNEVLVHSENTLEEDITFRYCTEAIIKDVRLDKISMQHILQAKGDSVVVAGSEKLTRIHVHTNKPADLFHQLKDYGTITFQKVDDMVRQNEVITNRKWKIALVTDSTCDLSAEIIDKYQINVLPMNINFGDYHYLDKVTIQPEQFYDLLNTNPTFPKTAQINERSFTNLYSHLASHYDAIVSVHLTSQFSGTYLSSKKAAERISKEFNKPVIAIDSKNLSGALGLIVLRVAEAIEKGVSFSEIQVLSESWVRNSKIFVSVKTLKYMVKGGRVSPTKGFISNLLNVNPIVSMDEEGKSFLFGKTFSQKSNMKKVLAHIKTLVSEKGVWNYVVLHAHNLAGAEWYAAQMKLITGKEPVSVVNISPVIGMNAGIGTAAVALMVE